MQPHNSSNPLYPLRAARFSSKGKWKRLTDRHRDDDSVEHVNPPSFFNILSWNIDFAANNEEKRLKTALRHIQNVIFKCKGGQAPDPCCILLQEICLENFSAILNNEWIKNHFVIAPVSPEKWPKKNRYGCVTLVSRSLPVARVSSLWFGCSNMGRGALFVDVRVTTPGDEGQEVTLRIANTHLESLPAGASARPVQLGLISQLLREGGLHGGIVAGDMNAIGPSDVGIVANAKLRDACNLDDDEEVGYTWGYQPECEFPPGRLDKILHVPGRGYDVSEPVVLGIDVKTKEGQYVSDHYALMSTVEIFSK